MAVRECRAVLGVFASGTQRRLLVERVSGMARCWVSEASDAGAWWLLVVLGVGAWGWLGFLVLDFWIVDASNAQLGSAFWVGFGVCLFVV